MFKSKRLIVFLTVVVCAMCLANTFVFAAEVPEQEASIAEVPGYVEYAVANLEADPEDDISNIAQLYVDNYDSAIGSDPDVEINYKAAVERIRESVTPLYASLWSILPPIIAIVLALITKEVYSSLFLGILSGGLLYAVFNFEGTVMHVLEDGFVASLADSYNVGILIFLVLLGTLVAMMNKAGGSAAFGRWAKTHIKSRVGAQLATIALGCLIFVDDYFNCLTVGSIMRPVADSKNISRAKLSYLIDATAAPVCIIAPISSWAAAVAGFAPEGRGLQLFIGAIPFNFYAILTIVMVIMLAVCNFDYGKMRIHERNAEEKGDIFTTLKETAKKAEKMEEGNARGKVIDLIIPVVVLIVCCMVGMIYSGGFFDASNTDCYLNLITSFSKCDASVGLAVGSLVAIVLSVIYFVAIRLRVVKFTECMACLPEGFKAMVPAILILTFAWTLKSMTDSLGATVFIADIVRSSAGALINFLPAIIFLIAVGLSFSTGTSWGTFGILIPIVIAALGDVNNPSTIVAISACMAGAVCGDHCSPISDTTIMASAGAQCDHVNHVSTQLPYAITVAGVSFVCYIIAGFAPNALIVLPISILLMIGTLFVIKTVTSKKA